LKDLLRDRAVVGVHGQRGQRQRGASGEEGYLIFIHDNQ
jgi:hypothetical protein